MRFMLYVDRTGGDLHYVISRTNGNRLRKVHYFIYLSISVMYVAGHVY